MVQPGDYFLRHIYEEMKENTIVQNNVHSVHYYIKLAMETTKQNDYFLTSSYTSTFYFSPAP